MSVEKMKAELSGFVAVAGLLLALASLAFGFWEMSASVPANKNFSLWPWSKQWKLLILVFWTLVPPLAFWLDFYWLKANSFVRPDEATKLTLDLYKYGIDVSSKIWLAFNSVLLVLYFGKDIAQK